MPELPEAETLARQLQKTLAGRTVLHVKILRDSVLKSGRAETFEKFLSGRKIEKAARRGKFIVLFFENGCKVWVHLGMTGQLMWDRGVDESHVHAIFEFADGGKLVYRDIRRFGGLVIEKNGEGLTEGIKKLGAEPLEISAEALKSGFGKRKGRIKNLLMNQRILAGLGNIYADESLFRAGIDPRKRPYRLTPEKWAALHRAIRQVLNESIEAGGSSIDDYRHLDGKRGEFQKRHRVYGRAGKPCRSCGAVIRRIVLSGRSTFFCPKCQF